MCNREITKEMAMDNTTKENVDQDENSFTHVPKTWVVAYERQREIQETEGGGEWIDKASVYDKETEQSSTRNNDRQAGQVDPKDVITTSNKDDTSIVVNSNTRAYHECGP